MDAMKDLRAFILIMVILAFVWLFTGGPLRPSSKSGWFLFRPQQKGEQKAKKEVIEVLGKKVPVDETEQPKTKTQSVSVKPTSSSSQSSIKPDFVTLKERSARETDPNQEYLEIKADKKNKSPMKITGWKLKGKGNFDVAINRGSSFIYAETASQPQEDIYLKPGEKAVIVTGKSPLGTSFKLNKCAGYFEQFHEFSPNLNTNCPFLRDENLPKNIDSDDKCFNYIEKIAACKTVSSIPYKDSGLSSSCQDYLTQNANYKSCAEKHKGDADFYVPEWRVYLGRNKELWKKSREIITLYDDKNNIIDSVSY